MSVKIRLKRVGAKNHPVFRIVVADSRSPRDGKFIEELGTYHPQKKSDNFKFDLERAQYWIGQGAQPSPTMASFIKKAVKAASATPEETATTPAPAAKAAAPVADAPASEAPADAAPPETPAPSAATPETPAST